MSNGRGKIARYSATVCICDRGLDVFRSRAPGTSLSYESLLYSNCNSIHVGDTDCSHDEPLNGVSLQARPVRSNLNSTIPTTSADWRPLREALQQVKHIDQATLTLTTPRLSDKYPACCCSNTPY